MKWIDIFKNGVEIGLNIFCDFLEKQGVNIISGSGFYRYKRNG
jgi:hypothetical protein